MKDQHGRIDWNATEEFFEAKTIAEITAWIENANNDVMRLRDFDMEFNTDTEGDLWDEMSCANKMLNIKKNSTARKIQAKLTPMEWDAIQTMRQANPDYSMGVDLSN